METSWSRGLRCLALLAITTAFGPAPKVTPWPSSPAAQTDDVAKAFAAQLAPLCDPTAFAFVDSWQARTVTSYRFDVAFGAAKFAWYFALDTDGKIAGLRPVSAA